MQSVRCGKLNEEDNKAVNHADRISQMLMSIQNEKMKVDQDLANEMTKHLLKMKVKQM